MKTIPLKKAHEILCNANGLIIVGQGFADDFRLEELTGDKENEFLYAYLVDPDGGTYVVRLFEGNNAVVQIDKDSLYFTERNQKNFLTEIKILTFCDLSQYFVDEND